MNEHDEDKKKEIYVYIVLFSKNNLKIFAKIKFNKVKKYLGLYYFKKINLKIFN